MKIRTIFKNLKKDQIIAIISGTLNIISMMLTAILIQRVFDSFSGGNYNDVKENSLYFLILLGLNIIFNYIFQYYYRLIEYTGSFPLRKFLLTNFLKSDYETSAKFKKGEMITAITDDSLKISEVYATGFIHMIIEAIQFLSCLIIISYYNILIGIFCLTLVVIGIILTKKISLKIGEGSSLLQEKTAIEQSKIIEILDGLRIIKQLKKEDYFFKIYSKTLKNKENVAKSLSRNFALYADIYTFISNILPLLTILISLYFMLNSDMTIGAAIGIYSIVGALTEPISLFSNFLNNYRISNKIIEKDKKLLNFKNEEEQKQLDEFKKLDFNSKKYNFGEKKILENVSFSLKKGSICVLKGESGVGKSTIFNFINKFIVSDDVDVFLLE
ncbi:MAG: ABC transporter ATP-binding protein [Tissierellia bacterium]|nr:ABC transporter ATP-binding protein [Tissierellia bacterium]